MLNSYQAMIEDDQVDDVFSLENRTNFTGCTPEYLTELAYLDIADQHYGLYGYKNTNLNFQVQKLSNAFQRTRDHLGISAESIKTFQHC